ncbi:MAG: DUF1553 domain-containing protein [Candidatus Zipacnadales bacterium]
MTKFGYMEHMNSFSPLCPSLTRASAPLIPPFESERWSVRESPIDVYVQATLRDLGLEPAPLCSDTVFFRRAHLDVIGTLPDPLGVRMFLGDRRPNKRALLIEQLLKREEFAEYWALKWCDLLRVKAEYPINLWPNAVQAYHRWILDSIRENKPYDQFARELLTSSGSNFRVPPVNFYRAIQGRQASSIASAVALTFMGTRLESWPADQRANLEAFFSRLTYKPTAEWKEEIVQLAPDATAPLNAVFPDGTKVRIEGGEDPRKIFANWLIRPENPWFARNIVNRIWYWLLGRGIIHEPDDTRPDNPPVHPKVLTYLEEELVKAHWDLRQIYRLILNSATYQQSSIPRSPVVEAERVFACYPVKRLEAEVLIDALCWVSGTSESYESAIPEPFTFIPESHRTIELADGSITSQFLEMFGRPPRDTGLASERDNEPTDAQCLHLLNSSHIQRKIANSWRLKGLVRLARGNSAGMVEGIYLTILSRLPTPNEMAIAQTYFQESGLKAEDAATDLAWALINTREFLYRH